MLQHAVVPRVCAARLCVHEPATNSVRHASRQRSWRRRKVESGAPPREVPRAAGSVAGRRRHEAEERLPDGRAPAAAGDAGDAAMRHKPGDRAGPSGLSPSLIPFHAPPLCDAGPELNAAAVPPAMMENRETRVAVARKEASPGHHCSPACRARARPSHSPCSVNAFFLNAVTTVRYKRRRSASMQARYSVYSRPAFAPEVYAAT